MTRNARLSVQNTISHGELRNSEWVDTVTGPHGFCAPNEMAQDMKAVEAFTYDQCCRRLKYVYNQKEKNRRTSREV